MPLIIRWEPIILQLLLGKSMSLQTIIKEMRKHVLEMGFQNKYEKKKLGNMTTTHCYHAYAFSFGCLGPHQFCLYLHVCHKGGRH
uniref:Uncharacterized protein n=1 Tax=Rhizophora mucronata TaxID=61149 RepID=A0A2P2MY26_RHIMU